MTTSASFAFRWVRSSSGVDFAIVYDRELGAIHPGACDWLASLVMSGASPNTVRNYGFRVAGYLSWLSTQAVTWTEIKATTLVRWKNHLFASPSRGRRLRAPSTVGAWLVALIEFYKWAAMEGLVSRELIQHITEQQVVRPGVRGGEHGRIRSVAAKSLRVRAVDIRTAPPWLSAEADRRALLELRLRPRDRFLVDLLYFSGLRIGEALSLYRENLHLLADNAPHGCRVLGPHVHIVRNPSANGARAKSLRTVPVPAALALTYQEAQRERTLILTRDASPNVFVALEGPTSGLALSYAAVVDLFERWSARLGFYVRPHLLRHTRATIWVRGIEGKAVDLDVVRVLLGHRSIGSTMIYTHAGAELLRSSVANASIRLDGAEQ